VGKPRCLLLPVLGSIEHEFVDHTGITYEVYVDLLLMMAIANWEHELICLQVSLSAADPVLR